MRPLFLLLLASFAIFSSAQAQVAFINETDRTELEVLATLSLPDDSSNYLEASSSVITAGEWRGATYEGEIGDSDVNVWLTVADAGDSGTLEWLGGQFVLQFQHQGEVDFDGAGFRLVLDGLVDVNGNYLTGLHVTSDVDDLMSMLSLDFSGSTLTITPLPGFLLTARGGAFELAGNFEAIPEPGSLVLLVAGGALGALLRRPRF